MINGAHIIIYSTDAERDRAFYILFGALHWLVESIDQFMG
jgi:hypothetical protein